MQRRPGGARLPEQHSCHHLLQGIFAAVLLEGIAVRVVSPRADVLAGWRHPLRAGARPPLSHREPIFNVPGVVLCLLAVFFAVHLGRWALSPADNRWMTELLAFIPARTTGAVPDLPGGRLAGIASLVTHIFVHGDLPHLFINSAWLLAFGSPVARRTDPLRFLAFFLLTGIAGALFYLAINGNVVTLLVGASGAISGLMGAAFRFMFAGMEHGGPGLAASDDISLTPLSQALRDRRILLAVAGWTGLNILLAWWAAGLTEAAGIAWEAHLGGFYAGFLLYGLFDRPRLIEDDA